MKVFVARDGTEIGEYEHHEVARLARTGELQATDYCWHEGLAGWLPLPDVVRETEPPPDPPPPDPPSPPERQLPPWVSLARQLPPWAIPAVIGASVIAVCAAAYFLTVRAIGSAAATKPDSPLPRQQRVVPVKLTEEAMADLNARLQRLPTTATPPLNVSYRGVAASVIRSASPPAVVISGEEEIVDAQARRTAYHTAFTLTVEYDGRDWAYTGFRAYMTDVEHGGTTELHGAADDEELPPIAETLGLKKKSELDFAAQKPL